MLQAYGMSYLRRTSKNISVSIAKTEPNMINSSDSIMKNKNWQEGLLGKVRNLKALKSKGRIYLIMM